MKKSVALLALICSTASFAHEPFLTPSAYITENKQIPVLASYTEEMLIPEYAMKDVKSFQMIDPKQNKHELETSMIKSATFANLELKEQGTYTVSTRANYPLKYVYHDKKWKKLYDTPADKAKPLAERDYMIPSDFKKAPQTVDVTRHWLIQSFVTKEKISDVQTVADYPLNVTFTQHPNQLKANQSVTLTVTQDKQPILSQVEVHTKGTSHQKALLESQTNALGQVNITFPKAGEYVITVHQPFDENSKHKPTDQHYVITTVQVTE
ncbi:DUF4198 domain-containing protein [Moraxella sp. ZY210820]|uniref:DUF4198 domain-containing protein n=1 Tax=unclassified Moraxella TaxID=2685852 RepID=UPI0027315107|nr:DUF4198 domain-containing protein [Moraxella sp. ZY210820]WLF83671.1 DUF4198 domain-containing protein [Moraxella sp. ZY210820]